MGGKGGNGAGDDRAERLKRALRANLRRRKRQPGTTDGVPDRGDATGEEGEAGDG